MPQFGGRAGLRDDARGGPRQPGGPKHRDPPIEFSEVVGDVSANDDFSAPDEGTSPKSDIPISAETAFYIGSSTDSIANEDIEPPLSLFQALSANLRASLPDSPTAQTEANAGPFAVSGGIAGSSAGQGDYFYDSATGILHIHSSVELTISTPSETSSSIQIDAGVKGELILAGVKISSSALSPLHLVTNLYDTQDGSRATEGSQIVHQTSLYLKIADGTSNSLKSLAVENAGIYCGEGSELVIDDACDNRAPTGEMAVVKGAKVVQSITLKNGKTIRAGSSSVELDSPNPGTLEVLGGGGGGAGIGSTAYENGGTITINGGNIRVDVQGSDQQFNAGTSFSAGIGAGSQGDGTATAITINGGNIEAQGGCHGAGIGAGVSDGYSGSAMKSDVIKTRHTTSFTCVAGDIFINGGFVKSSGGWHGGAFGSACWSKNTDHTISVTGGTLLPVSGFGSHGAETGEAGKPFPEIGGVGGYVLITGGSIRCTDPNRYFQGIGGTAWGNTAYEAEGYDPTDPDDPNKVTMVTIDLGAELKANNQQAGLPDDTALDNLIEEWSLHIAGQEYDYGAPAQFDDGKLYLWLPKEAAKQQIAVELAYRDKNGDLRKVLPLYREPGQDDSLLKRYRDFEVTDASYLVSLTKPYDGLPLPAYDLSAPGCAITTPAPDNKVLDRVTDDSGRTLVRYTYQPFNRKPSGPDDEPTPTGPETSETTKDTEGNEVAVLPADAGAVKLTMISKQYADEESSDEQIRDFAKSYWGHRAFMWGEITPVPSAVTSVKATWDDGSEVADPQDPAKVLDVEVDVTSGIFDDGTPTAATCKAPEGRVQLYVDGKEAGEPVAIVFGDASARAASDAGDGADGDAEAPAANARVVTGTDGREHTVVSWSFPAGDLMAPGARHTLTARYLPSKNYLPSANPEEEETPESQVAVKPDPTIAPTPKLSKSVKNLTHPNGPTQPGDRLRYRIEAANTATGSLWTQVVVTDPLPACLDLDPDSVKLTNTWEALDAKALTQAAAVTASDVGRFSIGAAAGSGRAVLTVPAGAVASLSPAVVEFECVVKEGLDLAGASADDLALGNIAEATGTRPNPDDPDGKDIGPMDPDPSPEATPPGPATVAPADPTEGDVAISKSVENLKHPDGGATEVGDRLRYTVELENRGGADTALYDAVISDPLPAGIELVPGTIQLAGPASDAEGKQVPDTAYDTASRTLAVAVGDLYGGQKWTLTFECEVTAEAVGADIANIAFAHGTPPSENPGRDPQKPGTEPGEAARPPAADDEPEAASDPVSPPEVLPADPAEGDVSIAKTVANLTHDDGTTHVGDTLRYEIALANSAPGTGWVDAVIRDDVPVGVEPVSGTVVLTLADGTSIEVDDAAYDPATRILAVAVGRLYGGQEARLAFEALVTADAVGADIGNVAVGYGTPPSQRDPDASELVPGAPFSPAEGWDAYEARQDVQRVRTDPVYPEGGTAQGGVIDDGARPDEAATIRRRLAQTGDALLAAALMPAACALAAGAALLASRRRARRAR